MSADRNVDREVFGAYVCDEETSQLLAPIIQQLGWSSDRIFMGGIAAGVRSHGAMPSPEFLIVDLTDSENPRSDINELAEVCEPGTVVLAIGTTNDVTFYRELIHSGIQDYLVKPLTHEALSEAIYSAEAAMHVPSADDTATVVDEGDHCIMFISTRGGAGASTMAANTAWYLAQDKVKQTALLDMDMQFGTDAMQFDLEPGRGLADALDNPNRVDSLFIDRAVVKPQDNLAVLGAESPLGDPVNFDPAAINHLVDTLNENYDNVIIDVPRSVLTHQPAIFAEASDIVIVTDLSLIGARDTIRMLAHIKNIAPKAKTHLMVNKTLGVNLTEVSPKDFAASVEHEINLNIPLDTKTFVGAAKKGEVLMTSYANSKPGAVIKNMIEGIYGKTDQKSKSGIWSKISGKK